ncbi:MAG: PEGA domain-containing protein [Lentisphaerae bacterium]|nr:MAG: PEGA domain-containing protein [Lentisphaerota bacterium]
MANPLFKLVFVNGEKEGQEIVIPPEGIVLGRDQQFADYTLESESVSRRHARLLYIEDALCIEDLESTNGIIVNGEQITRRQLLNPGDIIQICEFDFRVEPIKQQSLTSPVLRITILLCILLATIATILFWLHEIPRIKAELALKTYTVILKTEPAGAEVYDHGRLIGKTPLELTPIPAGKYRLLFYLPGYEDRIETVLVPQGQSVPIYTLKPVKTHADITITTLPAGAKIFFDGRLVGTSASATVGISPPFTVKNIDIRKEHQVYMEYNGQRTPVITLSPGQTRMQLILWRPDHLIKLRDGSKKLVMIKQKHTNGNLTCLISPAQEMLIKKQNILSIQKITPPVIKQHGIKTRRDTSGTLELIVDPFPQ